jgi:sigma-B regulation protein RsbU (phosphoserine phosphatase)
MKELAEVLEAFHMATACEAVIWTQAREGAEPTIEASTPGAVSPPAFPPGPSDPPRSVYTARGELLVAAVPGPRHAWTAVGPCPEGSNVPLTGYLKFLLPVVGQYLQAALEVEHAANELAERYEEINLLYTISEILGRAVTLDETAATILKEVSETVGARRASSATSTRSSWRMARCPARPRRCIGAGACSPCRSCGRPPTAASRWAW